MRRKEHAGARALTAVGLAATLAYLVWRAAFSMSGTHWWLSLPAYAVELGAFLGAVVLAWALWPEPARDEDRGAGAVPPAVALDGIDAVVRVDWQAEHEVRATLLALRSVRHVDRLVVVDMGRRSTVADLAADFGAAYSPVEPGDRNGLRVVAAAVQRSHFLLLDAGDIPTADIVDRLVPAMADPHVAIVQGAGTTFAEDSPEHGPNGRHELVFERSALNPALGGRGAAMWLGSGSLVRAHALRNAASFDEPIVEAQLRTGMALLAAGWRIAAPRTVVLVHRTLPDDEAVYADRVQRARAARRMVIGSGGALRGGTLRREQRLALLAWAVRPLSGLRRAVFVAVLCAALIAGSAPFHASMAVLVAGWMPAFVYTSLGIALLSGWTLRPGDRVRWSLHTIGPAATGLRGGRQPHRRHRPIVALPSMQYGAGLIVAVVALSIVLMLRGLSDRVTHTLGTMPEPQLMALLLVSLWTLALSLDLLRVLARRAQMRRLPRVVSSLSATLDERAVSIVDLTALGAGILTLAPVGLGERVRLVTAIPTRTGVTAVDVECIVRNVSHRSPGEWRIGVEFVTTDDATANALAEYCAIEPLWERLGVLPGRSVTEARQFVYLPDPEDPSAGRMAVRLVSLVALVGTVASSVPSMASASASPVHRLTGTVLEADPVSTGDGGDPPVDTSLTSDSLVDSDEPTTTTEAPLVESAPAESQGVEGAVVVAVCSEDAGADGTWGTADDSYGPPVSTVTGSDGDYELVLVGDACWATVAPPSGYDDPASGDGVAPTPTFVPVDVSEPSSYARTRLTVGTSATTATRRDGSLAAAVWRDLDGNGSRGAAEPGAGDVTVTLYDDHGRAVARTATDAEGGWSFTGLVAGDYAVGVSDLPAGTEVDAVDAAVDAVTGRSAVVTVGDGEAVAGPAIALRDGPASAVATAAQHPTRVLPAPSAAQVADGGRPVPSTLAMIVLMLAGLLALSIMFGLVRPRNVPVA